MKTYFCREYPEIGRVKCASIAEARKIFNCDCDEPKPWQGWPALLGQEQYPYEHPRTTTDGKDRTKRLKALGNAVVPAQAYPFFRAIAEIERSITNDC